MSDYPKVNSDTPPVCPASDAFSHGTYLTETPVRPQETDTYTSANVFVFLANLVSGFSAGCAAEHKDEYKYRDIPCVALKDRPCISISCPDGAEEAKFMYDQIKLNSDLYINDPLGARSKIFAKAEKNLGDDQLGLCRCRIDNRFTARIVLAKYLRVELYENGEVKSGFLAENGMIQVIDRKYLPPGTYIELYENGRLKKIKLVGDAGTNHKVVGLTSKPYGTVLDANTFAAGTTMGFDMETGDIAWIETAKDQRVFLFSLEASLFKGNSMLFNISQYRQDQRPVSGFTFGEDDIILFDDYPLYNLSPNLLSNLYKSLFDVGYYEDGKPKLITLPETLELQDVNYPRRSRVNFNPDGSLNSITISEKLTIKDHEIDTWSSIKHYPNGAIAEIIGWGDDALSHFWFDKDGSLYKASVGGSFAPYIQGVNCERLSFVDFHKNGSLAHATLARFDSIENPYAPGDLLKELKFGRQYLYTPKDPSTKPILLKPLTEVWFDEEGNLIKTKYDHTTTCFDKTGKELFPCPSGQY